MKMRTIISHATAQYKQPGSSVKPFLDYAPTFDYLGWATDHVLVDKAITYGNWTYKNANGQYYGRMNLQTALARSLNTPAIQALQAMIDKQGIDWYIDYMKKLGFNSDVASSFDISYAIGGNNFTCTPEQLMAAHATIMNGGYYITPHTITKISFRSGSQTPIEPTYEKTSVMQTSRLSEDWTISSYPAFAAVTVRNGAIIVNNKLENTNNHQITAADMEQWLALNGLYQGTATASSQ